MRWYNMKQKYKNYKYIYYILQIVNIVISIYVPILTKKIIDLITLNLFRDFLINSTKFILIIAVFIFTLSISNYYKTKYEEQIIKEYRLKIYEYLGFSRFNNITKKNTGYFINRYNEDIEKIRSFIIEVPFKKVIYAVMSIVILIIMALNNIYFTLVLTLVFPLFFLIKKHMTTKLKKLNEIIQQDKEVLNNSLEELVNYNYTIRANNAVAPFLTKNAKELNNYFKDAIKILKVDILYDYFFSTGLLNCISIIVYVFGGYLAINNKITVGTLTMFSLYYSKLWNPIEFYINYPKSKTIYEVHMKRLEEILNFKKKDNYFNIILQKFRYMKLDNVSITHEDKTILAGINLVIKSMDKIGIKGANGSGKTSLANIIAGIQDNYSGVITINDISYQDLNEDQICKTIRLIPDKPDIFYGTIIDNITMFQKKDITSILPIIKVLEKNNIELNTTVGGNLQNLSAGEKKLIQLARGLLYNADVYILDEPLNYVDQNYKSILLNFIREHFADKTLIIISHDKDAFNIVNDIYIIDNKKLKKIEKSNLNSNIMIY